MKGVEESHPMLRKVKLSLAVTLVQERIVPAVADKTYAKGNLKWSKLLRGNDARLFTPQTPSLMILSISLSQSHSNPPTA